MCSIWFWNKRLEFSFIEIILVTFLLEQWVYTAKKSMATLNQGLWPLTKFAYSETCLSPFITSQTAYLLGDTYFCPAIWCFCIPGKRSSGQKYSFLPVSRMTSFRLSVHIFQGSVYKLHGTLPFLVPPVPKQCCAWLLLLSRPVEAIRLKFYKNCSNGLSRLCLHPHSHMQIIWLPLG